MTADADARSDWVVVMPVKVLSAAKTRLDAAGGLLESLAFAFFQDTLTALLASSAVARVIVATADHRVAEWAAALGCTVVSDVGHPGINPAARWAALQALPTSPIAVMVSDLPSLTPAAVDAVLAAASVQSRSFLADAAGTGTTMWMAAPGQPVDPRFGLDSCAAHVAAGNVDLARADDLRLHAIAPARRDVDTDADLADARHIGLGAHTRDLLEAVDRGAAVPLLVTAIGRNGTGDLDAVDESGVRHHVPWPVLSTAGFRDVHAGQRLVIMMDPPGSVGSVSLP